ncbi:MAG TPA: dihydrodipicolinate synthase family protein [Candidatus Paceibacterota bacterium]|nr:dihydrodipicolinate synthase family protein [Verrucomicrobiota bacterium]HRZ45239.1 dihydrodipicolinate synthase family protein [Candidatus Paceibacterota bacterium]HRZ91782.1 dihydrodipicolinate synthase family protein [Candidatus Paceibacterota bacterium]
MNDYPLPPAWVTKALLRGLVIPAHPLALDSRRRLDRAHQRALTRYYHAAGAGGVAVGVHTTQFEIRDPRHGLLDPVWRLAAETVRDCDRAAGRRTVLIAGLCGPTGQAVDEARRARALGYHAGLLSLAALSQASDAALVGHARRVAGELPIMGFYLQPAVGGRELPLSFWRRFVEIPNVVAIKIAPFDRYRTLDVVRAVAESGRCDQIALYTGNDDHIVLDLLCPQLIGTAEGEVVCHFAGGLLGHWAFWTRRAVELLEECRQVRLRNQAPRRLLALAGPITEANAAIFDAAHGYAGCIPGIHEVLRRQGLLASRHCLDPRLKLSPGQAAAINRVLDAYPHLADDAFVRGGLERWLRD